MLGLVRMVGLWHACTKQCMVMEMHSQGARKLNCSLSYLLFQESSIHGNDWTEWERCLHMSGSLVRCLQWGVWPTGPFVSMHVHTPYMFFVLPSLLHSSILFNCFFYACCYPIFVALGASWISYNIGLIHSLPHSDILYNILYWC